MYSGMPSIAPRFEKTFLMTLLLDRSLHALPWFKLALQLKSAMKLFSIWLVNKKKIIVIDVSFLFHFSLLFLKVCIAIVAVVWHKIYFRWIRWGSYRLTLSEQNGFFTLKLGWTVGHVYRPWVRSFKPSASLLLFCFWYQNCISTDASDYCCSKRFSVPFCNGGFNCTIVTIVELIIIF